MPNKTIHAANDNQVAVGIDLGVSCFAILSTGEVVTGPKPHKQLLARLKRLSRSLSRKQKKSKNRKKAKLKLSRLHYRISNIRHDSLHKLTTRVIENFRVVGIEDLHVKGMMRNRKLSRSIADMGWHEFRRQLEYKALTQGKNIVVADRWFASSKTCSHCSYKLKSLLLSQREWVCPQCLTKHDRDLNAAKNLEKLAISSIAAACGVSSNGTAANAAVSYDMTKQEFNAKSA